MSLIRRSYASLMIFDRQISTGADSRTAISAMMHQTLQVLPKTLIWSPYMMSNVRDCFEGTKQPGQTKMPEAKLLNRPTYRVWDRARFSSLKMFLPYGWWLAKLHHAYGGESMAFQCEKKKASSSFLLLRTKAKEIFSATGVPED